MFLLFGFNKFKAMRRVFPKNRAILICFFMFCKVLKNNEIEAEENKKFVFLLTI